MNIPPSEMFQILVFSLLFFSASSAKVDWSKYEEIDPTKYDYCKQNCDKKAKSPDDGGGTHPACDCTQVPPRELFNLSDHSALMAFRTEMLEIHNYWRNFTAGGSETRPEGDPIPSAADMEVLNYDLELEYIARCRAINSFGATPNGHEFCVRMASGRPYGQNLALLSNYWLPSAKKKSWEYTNVKVFYDEVGLLYNASTVYKYDFHPPIKGKGMIGHWSAMIWHTINRIGCVRVYQPKHKMDPGLRFHLICNFACDHSFTSSNIPGDIIFVPGEPCSKCPMNKKCNDKYTALCGELRPVPTAPMYGTSSSTIWRLSGFAVFLLNYTLYFILHNLFL